MILENGVLTLHQSDLSHYIKCPEQARVAWGAQGNGIVAPPGPRVENDAALVGTTLHLVIEADMRAPFKNVAKAKLFARESMANMILEFMADEIEYRDDYYGGPEAALKDLDMLVESWYTSDERTYWLQLAHEHPDKILVEWEFDVPFITGRDSLIREVRLAGRADIVDTYNHRVVDWKSASKAYQRWEYQRWAVQPTAYLYAASSQGLIVPHQNGYQFDYRVFVKGKVQPPQEVTVWRNSGQFGWLVTLCSNVADMLESNAERWPLRDDGWWCGPKWCANWENCKGAFVSDDWK